MVNTTDRPITVDGVRLDTLAWNVESIESPTAGRRSGDYDIAAMDGLIPSTNDALEAASFGLQMWLRGTDVDGVTPGAGQRDTFRANLDSLLHLFGKRHALLDVQRQVNATETRRAWAKVQDVIAPDPNVVGTAGRFAVAMTLPYAQWEDLATADFSQVAPVTAVEVTTMRGATERTNDAIFLVTGPATTPRITDPATGMYVELGVALTAGQFWRFNSGTWASRYGSGLGLGSADTTGTDGTAVTVMGGPSRAYGLPLVPVADAGTTPGTRRVKFTLTAASGISAGVTALAVRAKRKYAA